VAANQLWNANIQYHSLLIAAIPQGARHALDVGCGDGILAAQLVRAGVPHVVGLDVDENVLERAKARHRGVPVEWHHGDIFDAAFSAASFDAVLSVATLHHLNAEQGLARFAELVAPGGVVAAVGLAANDWWDLPYALVGHSARFVGLCARALGTLRADGVAACNDLSRNETTRRARAPWCPLQTPLARSILFDLDEARIDEARPHN
jgi:SAM-dependent methyltransferase